MSYRTHGALGIVFGAWRNRAGVPEKSQPLHALRTTFASNLLTAGVPIFKVSKWLGHSTPQVLLTHYSGSSAAQREAVAVAIGGLVSFR